MAYVKLDNGIERDGPMVRTDFALDDHTPHWTVGRKGVALLGVTGHSVAGWLSLDALESYKPDDGRIQSKRTMLTLDRANAERLRDMLNLVLG